MLTWPRGPPDADPKDRLHGILLYFSDYPLAYKEKELEIWS